MKLNLTVIVTDIEIKFNRYPKKRYLHYFTSQFILNLWCVIYGPPCISVKASHVILKSCACFHDNFCRFTDTTVNQSKKILIMLMTNYYITEGQLERQRQKIKKSLGILVKDVKLFKVSFFGPHIG